MRVDASTLVVLDTGFLGYVTHPRMSADALSAQTWLSAVLRAHVPVAIPEIADYELRRELLLINSTRALHTLDTLKRGLAFLPLTNDVMLRAAQMWATVRRAGVPTADRHALDGDVIVAAQALASAEANRLDPLVITTNPKHMLRLISAAHWGDVAWE
jgi:predicted nucleic acid-binding protein